MGREFFHLDRVHGDIVHKTSENIVINMVHENSHDKWHKLKDSWQPLAQCRPLFHPWLFKLLTQTQLLLAKYHEFSKLINMTRYKWSKFWIFKKLTKLRAAIFVSHTHRDADAGADFDPILNIEYKYKTWIFLTIYNSLQ